MKNKRIITIVLATLIIVISISLFAYLRNKSETEYFCAPSLGKCTNPDLRHTNKTNREVETQYYSLGTGGYECSRPIKLESNTINKQGEYVDFKPVDSSEANLFCHLTIAEEYKGKIKVLQKPEVLLLIARYPYKDVSIKALEFKYIKDKEYVHRLLPDYKSKEIGCIILLDTPGVDKVYLEDEKLETFEELDYSTFTHYLKQVSPADKKLFFDNLK